MQYSEILISKLKFTVVKFFDKKNSILKKMENNIFVILFLIKRSFYLTY